MIVSDRAPAMAAAADAVIGSSGTNDCDLLLVGGGLANGLIALRLRQLRPHWRILLLEQDAGLGGNHTWSFHAGDLSAEQHAWVAPLVVHRWPGYDVAFTGCQRRLGSGYASVTSERFDAVLRSALTAGDAAPSSTPRSAAMLRTGVAVQGVTPRSATLADGTVLRARAVIDARGPAALLADSAQFALGWQKFLGQELRLAAPHGLDVPLLMDARVPQEGGYRFVYLLPFSADTLLVEDTCYSDEPELDVNDLRAHIAAYLHGRGWQAEALLREETGVLPITLDGDAGAYWRAANGQPRAGLAAGLFHPATGYSLPDAVRLADRIAALAEPPPSTELFGLVRDHALQQWRRQAYYRLLNRMLFRAATPAARRQVMQRFYRLREPLISRFYADRLTWLDKARILTGKPPVPLRAAWKAAWPKPDFGHSKKSPPDGADLPANGLTVFRASGEREESESSTS